MRFSIASLPLAALSVASIAQGLNIIVNNDDGFGAANIREFYRLLRAAGHDAIIVAPVVDNSGQGGRVSGFDLNDLSNKKSFYICLDANCDLIVCLYQSPYTCQPFRI